MYILALELYRAQHPPLLHIHPSPPSQGQLVSVSRLAKNSVAISPAIIKEFKTVRELSHENVNPILGACPEPGNIMIVSGTFLSNDLSGNLRPSFLFRFSFLCTEAGMQINLTMKTVSI